MPRATRTVRVSPIPNEPLRYWVESWSSSKPHLVDLSEHNGNGACSCKNYITRKWPAIRDSTAPLFTQETACRHIQAAWRHWLRHSLRDAAEIINKRH